MDKVIIFCCAYDCAHIYLFLKSRLGKERDEPVCALDLVEFRLVNLFTSCTQDTILCYLVTLMVL